VKIILRTVIKAIMRIIVNIRVTVTPAEVLTIIFIGVVTAILIKVFLILVVVLLLSICELNVDFTERNVRIRLRSPS